MKEKNYNYLSIVAGALLLIILIGASFAYFGSFNVNLNNNVAVNINAVSPGNATLISKSAVLNLQVPASSMSQTNAGSLASQANATLTVELTGSQNLATTCTYDVVYEYTGSNIYGTSPLTKNGDKEITIQVESPNGTNNFSTEKNFDLSNISSYKNGNAYTLVSGISITSTGTKTTQDIKITSRYYNLNTSQDNLAGKDFTGKIYAVKNSCETKEIEYARTTILKNNGGESVIKAKGNPDFSKVAKTNEGMYAMEDDLGTSYYFRGAVDNNWVKFGKYTEDVIVYRGYYSTTSTYYKEYSTMEECTSATNYNVNCEETKKFNKVDDIYWRIIRINGDGSVRMIYTGTTAPTESTKVVMTGEGTQIGNTNFNENGDKSEYVGYMYTIGEQHGISTDSTIKTYIDNWYKTTTLETDSKTKILITDEVYCNDRNVPSGTWESIPSSIMYYAFSTRINNSTNPSPSLKCTTASDKFTVNSSNGNGTLTYPVGLITADEIILSGMSIYSFSVTHNTNYYLYTATSYSSLSPATWKSPNANHVMVGMDGLLYIDFVYDFTGVRPVISISKDAILSGDGTWNNVYTVS